MSKEMRISMLVILLLLCVCCSHKQTKDNTLAEVDTKSGIPQFSYDSLSHTYIYEGDTIREKQYLLRNNYTLTITPVELRGNLVVDFRLKGQSIDSIIHTDWVSTNYTPKYDSIDFVNHFAIHKSAGHSTSFRLYDKQTGKECLYSAMQIDFSIENEALIYTNDDDKTYAYDVQSQESVLIEIPDKLYDKHECMKPFHTWRNIFVKKKTAQYYTIGIGTCEPDNPVEFRINR